MQTEEEKKAKRAAYMKAYWKANKEKVAAYQKAYWKANKERRAAYDKAYGEANKERRAALDKAYREANKEKRAALKRKYRSTKLKAYVPRCSHWESVEKQLTGRREELRAATGITYHIDHIYPLSKGGIDHPSNYQLLSPEENMSKGDKVDSSCPDQMIMKEVSELVLNLGMNIDSALQLTKRENI